jgi:hypothetical protein
MGVSIKSHRSAKSLDPHRECVRTLSGVYTGKKTLHVVAVTSDGDLKRWEDFYRNPMFKGAFTLANFARDFALSLHILPKKIIFHY